MFLDYSFRSNQYSINCWSFINSSTSCTMWILLVFLLLPMVKLLFFILSYEIIYKIFHSSPAKRRQFQRQLTLKYKKGPYEVSDKNMTQSIDISSNHVRPLDTSTCDNRTSVVSESIPSEKEKRPKSKHSAVSVCPVNRLPSAAPSQTKNELNDIKLNSASLHKTTCQTTSKPDHYQSNDDVSSEIKPNTVRRRISNAFSAVLITKIKKPSGNNNMKNRNGPIRTSIQRKKTAVQQFSTE